jgi:hypothetical protein
VQTDDPHKKPSLDEFSLWTEENRFITQDTLNTWCVKFDRVHPTDFEQRIADEMRKNTANFQARVLGGLMGVDLGAPDLNTLAIPGALNSTRSTEKSEHSLSIGDLDRTIENLNRLFDRSPLRAIWFVKQSVADEQSFLNKLTRGIGATFPNNKDTPFYGYLGVPIYYFDESKTQEQIEFEVKAGRWFVLMPGIWLEMSDGQHKKVSME